MAVLLYLVIGVVVIILSGRNALRVGCYWSERDERVGGDSLRGWVIGGYVASSLGITAGMIIVLAYAWPQFFAGMVYALAGMLTEGEIELYFEDVLTIVKSARDAWAPVLCIIFSACPVVFWLLSDRYFQQWERRYLQTLERRWAENQSDSVTYHYWGNSWNWWRGPYRRRPFRTVSVGRGPLGQVASDIPSGGGFRGGGGSSRGGGAGRSFGSAVNGATIQTRAMPMVVPVGSSGLRSSNSRSSSRSRSSKSSNKNAGQAMVILAIVALMLILFVISFLVAYGLVRWADARYAEYRDIEEVLETGA